MSTSVLVIGQGLCGTCVAWALEDAGVAWRMMDRARSESASRVAAGLVTPITGKKLNPSWRQAEMLPEAIAFYRDLERRLGVPFWHSETVVRLFASEAEQEMWERKKGLPTHAPWWGEELPELPLTLKAPLSGFAMSGGGWLDTRAFLDASRSHFLESGRLQVREATEEDRRDALAIFACEGAVGLLTSARPHRCAKGEILTVQVPGLGLSVIANCNGWLVPLGDDVYRLGSTYEWDDLDPTPTAAGRAALLDKLATFTALPGEVLEHHAGVRPIVPHRIPVVEREGQRIWINGLGSKGAMTAPSVARHAVRAWRDGKPVELGA